VLTAAALLARAFEGKLSRDWRIFVRGVLRDAAADLQMLIVMLALAHTDTPVTPPGATRPRSRRRGFRHARSLCSAVRAARRRVRVHGGTIAARIARLRGILADLKTWIARMIAHLDKRCVTARLVAVAPPGCVFAGNARPACVGADTS